MNNTNTGSVVVPLAQNHQRNKQCSEIDYGVHDSESRYCEQQVARRSILCSLRKTFFILVQYDGGIFQQLMCVASLLEGRPLDN
jgi:hypothetical protein